MGELNVKINGDGEVGVSEIVSEGDNKLIIRKE
jgi:hypothetical protein